MVQHEARTRVSGRRQWPSINTYEYCVAGYKRTGADDVFDTDHEKTLAIHPSLATAFELIRADLESKRTYPNVLDVSCAGAAAKWRRYQEWITVTIFPPAMVRLQSPAD
jgi:hypothetical protein